MSEQIYVVIGETGEYEDHQTWAVSAFRQEQDAKAYVQKAQMTANRIYRNARKGKNKYDPKMEMDCTGTNYRYICLELH